MRDRGLNRRDVLRLGLSAGLACAAWHALPGLASAHAAQRGSVDRLAVLSPALAVILRDLGLGDRIIARHGFDIWSEQSLPVVGDQAGIDYEALIRSDPSAVLLEWGRREIPARLQDLARERSWEIVNCSTLSLADIRETTRRLWAFTPECRSASNVEKAWTESRMGAELARAWSPRAAPAGIDRVGKVLLLISTDPVAAALGPGSSHAEILGLVGGTSALHKGLPYQELDAEDVLRLDPGAIVLLRPRTPGGSPSAAPLEERLTVALGPLAKLGLRAVREKRVAILDDPLLLLPSTSLIAYADRLAETLAAFAASAR